MSQIGIFYLYLQRNLFKQKTMRKLLLFLFLSVATVFQASATDYKYLTFQQADGTRQSFGVSGLKLTFSGGNMLVEQNGTTTTFPLSELSKMFFSEEATGIKQLPTEEQVGTVVYSLSGVRMGVFASPAEMQQKLPQGVYVMKKGDQTVKLNIK